MLPIVGLGMTLTLAQDMFGRKRALFFAILMFLFGSALCGSAKSITWLCVARGIQGIGGGGALQVGVQSFG